MSKELTLSEVLVEIIYEHDIGYEPFYEGAIRKVIDLLKIHALDHFWTEADVKEFVKQREEQERKMT